MSDQSRDAVGPMARVREAGRGPQPAGFEPEMAGVRKAVALEYRRGRQLAPVVVASGRGELAEQIIGLARKHGVYIQPDPALVTVLAQLDLGAAIPPQLYDVVAQILAFVYNLNSQQPAGADRPAEGWTGVVTGRPCS